MRERLRKTLERLAKWRTIFASWQVGTRSDTDPECKAIKDHRETTILLRAEVNALIQLGVHKGLFTLQEFEDCLENEAIALMKGYEHRFPGAKATDCGMDIDIQKAIPWMSQFPK